MFGTAWAFAWLALALAGWQVWLSSHLSRLTALGGWFALVLLTIGWSALFFGMHRLGWAWMEVSLLLAGSVYLVQRFRTLSPLAARLLGGFLVWIVYVWTWTLAVWTLNGGFLSRFL